MIVKFCFFFFGQIVKFCWVYNCLNNLRQVTRKKKGLEVLVNDFTILN